jgi:hypothetical protein
VQFDTTSVQLSATISELIERMRQAAYLEGRRESIGEEDDEAESGVDADVLTILRSPLPSAFGEYYPDARLVLLADDLPAKMSRKVLRGLLTGRVPGADMSSFDRSDVR